ncbi:MAG: hypothetical protein V6Z86_05675 [Hyphomicrobiales bacterium]
MNTFDVTYDLVTPGSAEQSDYAESGFLGKDMSLRNAIELFDRERDWTCGEVQFASGSMRFVSLRLPDTVTPSSRLRIARLIWGDSA